MIESNIFDEQQPITAEGEAIEVEISLPAADGSITIDLGGKDKAEPGTGPFGENLAEVLDETVLSTISSDLMALVDADLVSRRDWEQMFTDGLEVLGMKYEEVSEPWPNACGVYSTVLTEAAIRFQSESIMETFPAQGPVKTEIIGAIDKLKQEAAERVRVDMNYQLTEKMPEYRPDHERLLYTLGLSGSAFKKIYHDPGLGRQVAPFIPPEDIIVPYGASNLNTAERVTHLMRKTKNELRKLQVSGFYRDIDLGEPMSFMTDIQKKKADEQGFTHSEDNRYQILEVHTDYDIPGLEDTYEDGKKTGVALPYVITIDRSTGDVLSVYRNWEENDPKKNKRDHFVDYCYIPGFGFYGMGLIHLIGGYARAGTSILRQLVDAGTLSNMRGGLKTRGLRIIGDDDPISPGEWRDVDVPSGSIKDNVLPLPYGEPSATLAGLLDRITEEARRLGSMADMKISDMSANAPVGTTLAILERTLKTMGAVQARVHASMKREFKLLKSVIRDNAPKEYAYEPEKADRMAKQSDYDMAEVIPVSDPNSATMAQRIMQYQAVHQLSTTAPQIYDLPFLHRQMIEVLGVSNAEKIVPTEDDLTPKDPVTENMSILNGKPIKAFIYQDHAAHIASHQAFMQDPEMAAMIGQNPLAMKIQAAGMAHLAEHMAFSYRRKVEEQIGVPLPAPGADLPEDVEVDLSRLVAMGAQQLLQASQASVQQQQALQQAQDPMMQIALAEQKLKEADFQRKQAKDQADHQYDMAKLQQDAAKAAGQQAIERERIAAQDRQANQSVQVDLFKRNSKGG